MGYAHWFGRYIDMTGQQRALLRFPNTKAVTVAWQPTPLFKLSTSQLFMPGEPRKSWLRAELHLDLGQPLGKLFRSTAAMTSAEDLRHFIRHGLSTRNTDRILSYRADSWANGRPVLTMPDTFDLTMKTGKALDEFRYDTGGQQIAELLKDHDTIKIEVDAWVPYFLLLHDGQRFRNKVVVFEDPNRGRGTWIRYSGKKRALANRKEPYIFKNIDGMWHSTGPDGDGVISD